MAAEKDPFRMSAQKMLWHMDRVLAWKSGERIAPLHIDAGISRGCNISCHYCFGKSQGNLYRSGLDQYLPEDALINYFSDAANAGVRSIAVIGEAEPLLNPAVYRAIIAGKKAGADMALGTNGILFTKEPVGIDALAHLTWLRFNLSAASDAGYRTIHGSRDFDQVIDRIQYIVSTKHRYSLDLTLGIQMVLTPATLKEVVPLARLSLSLGVDYLVVKQCSDLRDGSLGMFHQLDRYNDAEFVETLREAESLSTADCRIIVKWQQLENQGRRSYSKCLGAPFLLHSTGDGRIYSCGAFFDGKSEQYLLGDLRENRFRDILQSERYWSAIERLRNEINPQESCYSNCRTNCVNEFLNDFLNPPSHVNFI